MVRVQKRLLTNSGGNRINPQATHSTTRAPLTTAWTHHPQTVERTTRVIVILGITTN